MSKALRTVGMVVGAVALIAATAGLAAPAVAATATTAASAGGILGVSAATLTAIGTYGSLAAGVLSMAAGALAPGFSAEGSASTVTTNPQSGLPYAIGRTRMSGLRVYARTYDGFKQQSKDDILAFVVMLSIAGPVHSIEKFTADNELVTFAPGEDGDANGRFYRFMAQRLSLGTIGGSALNMTFGGKPFPEWTVNHKLGGIAHAQWALRFDTDGDLYGAGAPEPAWVGKWVKVYDPRKDSTYPGGSGSHRALDESTYEWSDNPGLHALTWALGRWQNGKRVCGIGAPVANIRVAEFVECANVCDANDWKVGGVEWTTDSKWDTLKRMLQAGGAIPTQTGAMIGCLVSTPRTAIATIESRHLHDGLSIAATKSRRDRFNTVIPRYVDEDSDWAVISGTAVTEPVYVTADGGQRTKEIDFPLVQVFSGTPSTQPGQLAAYAIVNSREAGPFTWTTGPEWIGLKTGDVVYLNVPEEGLVNQPVLITRRAPDPATGKVSFAGETETYSKHAYALGQSTTPPAPFSLSAPDLKPVAPEASNWSVSGATSGEGFPALHVTGQSEMPSADSIIIDYRKSGTEDWTASAILSAVGPVSHTIAPLESETAYDVRIAYRVGTIDGNTTIFANVVTGLGKVTVIEGELSDIEADLLQLDIDTAQALINIAAAEATITQMQVDVATLGADILAARGDIDTVEATQVTQGAAITTLQTTADTQAGQLATLTTNLSTANANISTAQSAITGLNSSVASINSTLATQGANITANGSAITTLQGSVATLKTLVSAGGGNLLNNSDLVTTDGWFSIAEGGATPADYVFGLGPNVVDASWSVAGEGNLCIRQNTANAAGYGDWRPNQDVAVEGDKWYELSVRYACHRSNVQFFVRWLGADNAVLGTFSTAQLSKPQTAGGSAALGSPLESWGTAVLKLQAPTNAAKARFYFRKYGTSSGTNSFAWFMRPQFIETTADRASPVPYSTSGPKASVAAQQDALSTLTTQYASLSTTVGTQGVTITGQQTAITTINGNITTLFGKVGVTIDVDGFVSGWAMNNNGAAGDMIVNVDRFAVGRKVSGANQFQYPFQMVGSERTRLIKPPAATAPAPMYST